MRNQFVGGHSSGSDPLPWVGGWVGVLYIEFPAWPLWRALADKLPRILQPPVGIWARLGRETFVSEKGGAAKLGLAAGGERGLPGDSPRSCKGCSAGISVGGRAFSSGKDLGPGKCQRDARCYHRHLHLKGVLGFARC